MPVPFAIRIQRKNRKYITVHPNYTNEKVEYNTLYGQSIYGIRIGGQIMDENRLRNIRIYVVANEIGFIILWLLFLYLFRSDYREYLVFHGMKPYTPDTTGAYFYSIVAILWMTAPVPLIGIPIMYFSLWKKEDVRGMYRFVSYVSFGISLFMMAVMVFSTFFFDPTFYNADLQVVKNSAGQALTFPRLLIAPLVLAGVLMLVSGNNVRKIMPERKAEKKLREQGKL